ncbi:MAG: Ni/Fe-hydrogenase, b-type cytochrome subunit [Nitrospinae bacterium RIFCSPLOWO2_01_FULL_39_10]|nr:MAG: Ni/Fe-hydrogenase, b-type cytochrome subunit [Nitrospinae bacterium RIFCSPLOWO2_01_FULL_39_10]
MADLHYEKIYEWNLVYRMNHWLRAISIFTLIFTGYYIYWPFLSPEEDSQLMNLMRFFHFISMYIIILSFIAQLYFDRDIWEYMPTWNKIKTIPDMLAYYLFLKDTHEEYGKFNPLQALTYFFWGLLLIIETLTGFAIYSGNIFGIWDSRTAFGWVNNILGGMPITRLVHFAIMWIFIITVPVHVYMVILKNLTDRDSTFWSIFTGYKLKRTG